jgi:hypothetical protein
MKSIAGVFIERDDAVRGVHRLLAVGVESGAISFLTPDHPPEQVDTVPTSEEEGPGIGSALGAVVGGAAGAALGAAALGLIIPGVGPIAAIGFAAAAMIAGAGGAVAGAAVGDQVDDKAGPGLPVDDLFVYEDALRQGRSVVVALVPDELAESVRSELRDAGAETIDAAREQWWRGLRDAERTHYLGSGGDFERDERNYRRGFESALRSDLRGGSFDGALPKLSADNPDCYGEECFRRGYERGSHYYSSLRDRDS